MFVFFLFGLAVDAQTRHRPGLEAGNADVVAAVFANSVRTIINTGESSLDLADQAALAVTDAQGKRPVGLCSGAVSRVGEHFVAIRQLFKGAVTLLLRFCKHVRKKLAKVFQILVIHLNPPADAAGGRMNGLLS